MIKNPNAVQMKASAGPITVQLQGKRETASLFLGQVVERYGVLENSNWYEQTGPIKFFTPCLPLHFFGGRWAALSCFDQIFTFFFIQQVTLVTRLSNE